MLVDALAPGAMLSKAARLVGQTLGEIGKEELSRKSLAVQPEESALVTVTV